jgi:hypothetical protein
MALQLAGANGTMAQVGVEHQAVRIENRPVDASGLGSYGVAAFTGILPAALGANSEIFQFRWSDATRFCLIRKVRISACVSTTFFAAGVPVQIDAIKSTAWTVAGTGGATPTIAANLKKRTAMASSLIAAGDIRIATTAALGAGTKTLEGASFAAVTAPGPITASLNGLIIPPGTILWQSEIADGEYPFVLAQNEGFSVRSVAVPATGTWTATIEIQWAEVTAY